MDNSTIEKLNDTELLSRARKLAAGERAALCDFIEVLAELDRRTIIREMGYGSLFEFCVLSLRLSEGAAYRRIRAARAVRLFAPIGHLLRNGGLTLESVALLHPYLKDADAAELIRKAIGLRKWELEMLLSARRSPLPARDQIRFSASAATGGVELAPCALPLGERSEGRELESRGQAAPAEAMADSPHATAESPGWPPARGETDDRAPRRHVRVAFTADEEFFRLLSRARALTRHKHPDGRLAGVLTDALRALIAKKDPLFRVPDEPRRARGSV